MQLDQELIRTGLWHRDRLVRELVGFWIKEQTPALSVRSDEIARTYEQFGLPSISLLQPRTWRLPGLPRLELVGKG